MSDNDAGGAVENPNEDINWEERAKKAEAKIVDLKKSSKEVKEQQEETPEAPKEQIDESTIDTLLERREFIKTNPELADFEDRLKTLTSGGLTLKEAKGAILASNPEIANRQKTNSMSMTGEPVSSDKTVYTQEELKQVAKENQALYNQLTDKLDKGEITVK